MSSFLNEKEIKDNYISILSGLSAVKNKNEYWKLGTDEETIEFENNGSSNYTSRGYFENGLMEYQQSFSNGKSVGIVETWYENGNREVVIFYSQWTSDPCNIICWHKDGRRRTDGLIFINGTEHRKVPRPKE